MSVLNIYCWKWTLTEVEGDREDSRGRFVEISAIFQIIRIIGMKQIDKITIPYTVPCPWSCLYIWTLLCDQMIPQCFAQTTKKNGNTISYLLRFCKIYILKVFGQGTRCAFRVCSLGFINWNEPFHSQEWSAMIFSFSLSPEIYHTVWRTWHLIACSDESWLNYQFSLHHSYICSWMDRRICIMSLGVKGLIKVHWAP